MKYQKRKFSRLYIRQTTERFWTKKEAFFLRFTQGRRANSLSGILFILPLSPKSNSIGGSYDA